MISALNLIWIVPLAATTGLGIAALLAANNFSIQLNKNNNYRTALFVVIEQFYFFKKGVVT